MNGTGFPFVCLPTCVDDADCVSGQICRAGPTLESYSGPRICMDGCTTDGDCLPGAYCQAQMGRCQPAWSETCDDAYAHDEDGNGFANCDDPACSTPYNGRCPFSLEMACRDGLDDDGDELVDCADPDCAYDNACAASTETICDDTTDDDGDWMVDCSDPDCAGVGVCSIWWESQCGVGDCCVDTLDNDGNGLTDCDDPRCFGRGACAAELVDRACTDLIDEDGDYLYGCFDPDCVGHENCAEGSGQWGDDCEQNGDCAASELSDGRTIPLCSPAGRLTTTATCTMGCIAGEAGCPTGQTCIEIPNTPGQAFCVPWCSSDADCGSGELCQARWNLATHVCGPPCNSDADCGGTECNIEGRCTPYQTEICNDGLDDDLSGTADCNDTDCTWNRRYCPLREEFCTDANDNDGDGDADCADVDCWRSAACPWPCLDDAHCATGWLCDEAEESCFAVDPELNCWDGLDDDGDGLRDCFDPDCDSGGSCQEWDCADGLDNEGDLLVDCDDPQCGGWPACAPPPPEDCATFGDEDGDGWADCLDAACVATAACVAGGLPPGATCTAHSACLTLGDGALPVCLPSLGDLSIFEATTASSGARVCTETCDPSAPACPGGASCIELDAEHGLCVATCVGNSDCLNGQHCRLVDGLPLAELGVCAADCTTNSDCASSICDEPTGLCVAHTEKCGNGVDDNGDGAIDCADPLCIEVEPGCVEAHETSCGDGADNDADGFGDCLDPDCTAAAVCEVACGTTTCAIPPDPAAVAPELEPSDDSTLDQFGFLCGTSSGVAIQDCTGAAFDERRTALVQGRVVDISGEPLPGAKVVARSLTGDATTSEPESFGSTRSRQDGRFDLLVNAGSTVVLEFELAGYLPVQRREEPDANAVWPTADVVLTPEGEEVALSRSTTQWTSTSTSPVEDADGERSVTLMMQPGTSVRVNNTPVTASSLSIQVTEFTVGSAEDAGSPYGADAMPASLPPATAFTYAVDISLQTTAAGAHPSVTFTASDTNAAPKPIVLYLDNFLDFPVGASVPVGYYDYFAAAWRPEFDGMVVEVTGIDSSGAATFSQATWDAFADRASGGDLAARGLPLTSSDVLLAERQRLATERFEGVPAGTTFAEPTTFWRVPLSHFSTFDFNPSGVWQTNVPEPDDDEARPDFAMAPRECPTTIAGSIVECDRGVLSEVIELPGTGLSLSYSTDRLAATNRSMQFGFSCGALALGDYRLRVTIAGRIYDTDEIVERFCDTMDQRAQVVWDGRDLGGRAVEGAVGVHVWLAKHSVQLIRTCAWNDRTRTFGDPASGCPAGESTDFERRTGGAYRVVTWSGQMASLPAGASGFGEGWVLSGVHRIDPGTGVILSNPQANLSMDSMLGEGVDWPPTRGGAACSVSGMLLAVNSTTQVPANSADPVVEVVVNDEGDRYYRLRPTNLAPVLGEMDRDTCTVTASPILSDRLLTPPDNLGNLTIGRSRAARSGRGIAFLLADADTVTNSPSATEATVCVAAVGCWSQVFGPTPVRPSPAECATSPAAETVTGDGLLYRDCWHPEAAATKPYRYILGLVDFIDSDDGRYFVVDHGTHGQSLYYSDFRGMPIRVAGRGPTGDCDSVGDFAAWHAAAAGGAPLVNGRDVCLDGIRDLALHPDGGVHLLMVPDTNPGGTADRIGTVLYVSPAGMVRSEAGRLGLPTLVATLVAGGLVESLVDEIGDLLADGVAASEAVLHDPTSIETDSDGSVWVREGRLGRIRRFDATGISRTIIGCTEFVDGGDCGAYVHQRIGNPTNGTGIYLNAHPSFTLTGSEILVVTGTLPAHPGGAARPNRGLSTLFRGTRPATNGDRYVARPSENAWWLFDAEGRLRAVSDFITDAPRSALTYAGGALATVGVYDGPTLRQTQLVRSGGLVTVVPPVGRPTSVVVDPDTHRLLAVNQADGRTATFEYTDEGLMRSYTDADGIVHLFGYDRRGRLRFDESSNGMRLNLQYIEAPDRSDWSWVYAIRNTGRWWTVGRRTRALSFVDNCNEEETYASRGDVISGYCNDHTAHETISADSSGMWVHSEAAVLYPMPVFCSLSGCQLTPWLTASVVGSVIRSSRGETVRSEHDYERGGTVMLTRQNGLRIESCSVMRPGRFGVGSEPGSGWEPCGVVPSAGTVFLRRVQIMLSSQGLGQAFSNATHLSVGIERVVQWIPSASGWTVRVTDSDGPSTDIELDSYLRPTSWETSAATGTAPRARLHLEYATTVTTRMRVQRWESLDDDLDEVVMTDESTVSSASGVDSHERVRTAADGESVRVVSEADTDGWQSHTELRDADEIIVSEFAISGTVDGSSTTLTTPSPSEHTFGRDLATLRSTWSLPASDRCDTHDDCVPDPCDLVCLATALCLDGVCANGPVQPTVSAVRDHDGMLVSVTRPGGIVMEIGYIASVCFPEGGSCTTDDDCVEGGACIETPGMAPTSTLVIGDGDRALESWTSVAELPSIDAALDYRLHARSPTGVGLLTDRSLLTSQVDERWSDEPSTGAATDIAHVTVRRAPDGTLYARSVSGPDGPMASLNVETSSDGRTVRFDAYPLQVEWTSAVDEVDPSTTSVLVSAGAAAGSGVHEAALRDDFGRTTHRAYALAPVTADITDCAAFMGAAEGSGIYCETLEYDAQSRIVSHNTLIHEDSDGIDADEAAWDYGYTPGDGRLALATLNGTEGAEYAWSANGTLSAMVRDIARLPFRAVGGTEVEIDAQDRLWRFGDIRYGYTPDGRTTWRRERSSDGTERLLCLDYDVFSGLRGAQWVTEGSGEELDCDEVEEFDGEINHRLDATGRRIVTNRNVAGVPQPTEYLVYGDALHPIARLDDQRRVTQFYLYGDGDHSPTAMIAYNYPSEGSVERTLFGYVTDPRGSVRLVVQLDDGEVVQRLDYGPFGELLNDTNPGFQPFAYAGGIYEADTGLVRFGARDYDAETGRWLTRDPIGFAAGDANLFAYVRGDPVNSVDPTGLCDVRPAIDIAQYALNSVCEFTPGIMPMSGPLIAFEGVCAINTIAGFDDDAAAARQNFERQIEISLRQLEENGASLPADPGTLAGEIGAIVTAGARVGMTPPESLRTHESDCSAPSEIDRWGVPCR
jgi:RHS repeat-associated protein